MAETKAAGYGRRLNDNLERLAERADKVLRQAYLQTHGRQVLCRTVSLLFLFAFPLIVVELIRYLAGYPSFGLRGWQYGLLLVACAGAFAGSWLLRDYLKHTFARGKTLGLFDRQLGLANRLATANEFLGAPGRSAFMAAAIDDAVEPSARALGSSLQAVEADQRWPLSPWWLLSTPGTVALLLLTVWLGGLERANADDESRIALSSPDLAVVAHAADESAGETAQGDSHELRDSSQAGAGEKGAASGDRPESQAAETARNSGVQPAPYRQNEEAAGSQSGSAASAARGQQQASAASSQQSSGGDRHSADGQQSQQNSQDQQDAQAQSARQEQTQEASAGESSGEDRSAESGDSANQRNPAQSGSTQGADSSQGGRQASSSRQENGQSAERTNGSDQGDRSQQGNESAQGDRSEQGDQSEQGDPSQQGEQGSESSDANSQSSEAGTSEGQGLPQAQGEAMSRGEGEEQNSQNEGGQPGAQSDDATGGQGEGESGPSNDPLKDNRGAATAMLALPVGDRLIGSRGEGPEQLRQEQSVPEEKQWAPVAASARAGRGDRIGTLQHASVSGWSRGLVKSYFDRRRGETLGSDAEVSNTSTDDNGQGERE